MNEAEKTKEQLRSDELNDVSGGGLLFGNRRSIEKCRTEGHSWANVNGQYEQCENCGEIRQANHP